MIKKEFIDYLAEKLKIERKELIEKDLILHSLLYEIESDNYFRKNIFKTSKNFNSRNLSLEKKRSCC